jgi:hypothetical protein
MNALDTKTANINTLVKMLHSASDETQEEEQNIYLTSILDNKKIGSLLKSIRLIKSMTLVDIETITGISYQQIKKYEDNKSRISITNLKRVIEALGLKAELIITSAPAKKQETQV